MHHELYTRCAFPKNTASMSSCSVPSSANDSRASSYQSPALDVAPDDGEGEEPNRMRSYPNASSAGPTVKSEDENLSKDTTEQGYALYILMRFFHSFLSNVSSVEAAPVGAPGVGEPQTGGRNLMATPE